jgi:hypothetical protein
MKKRQRSEHTGGPLNAEATLTEGKSVCNLPESDLKMDSAFSLNAFTHRMTVLCDIPPGIAEESLDVTRDTETPMRS